ncbi:aminotransferase class I/II-fold pyridoxal phosphate-dependent enzyme [[Ruminococcus] torques]|nr:aminotransferase class I/II-fold pyridoxal phosphate-dependent enzyme [[Ruminococcus] torques]
MTSDEKLLENMEKMRQPWNVSVIAQEAGIAALDEKDRVEKMRRMIQIERMEIEKQLDILKIDFVSSDANFILIYSEINLFEELLQYGILIRDCANYRGLETGWYRIAVKQRHENEQLLKALKEIIERNRQEADIDGKTDHDTGNDVECREECAGRRSLPHLEGGRL